VGLLPAPNLINGRSRPIIELVMRAAGIEPSGPEPEAAEAVASASSPVVRSSNATALREARLQACWTQGQLGAALELSNSTVSDWERDATRLPDDRLQDALAALRGTPPYVVGGAPRTPGNVIDDIDAMRADGLTWDAIAEGLNRRRIPTSRGGRRWYGSTVRSASLSRAGLRAA
jgi:transcriptional regulator with XRE-family HTH domain